MTIASFGPIASQYAKSVASVQTLTALGFAQAQIDSADQVLITGETAAVRYTLDGTVATATIGHLIPIGASVTITGNALLRGLQFFGTGATVDVTLERFI
jgi:hypothetical protein